jgi:hypothetical protein
MEMLGRSERASRRTTRLKGAQRSQRRYVSAGVNRVLFLAAFSNCCSQAQGFGPTT